MGVKLFNQVMTHQEVMKVFTAGGSNSDLLTGGSLNEEQQVNVISFIRSYAVMLAPQLSDLNQFPANSPIGRGWRARTQSVGSVGGAALVPGGCTAMQARAGRIAGTYDQLHVGRTITRPATEGTQDHDQYSRNPAQFARRRYECHKLRSSMASTTEFFEQNIRQGTLNQELAAALAPRLAQDFEDLAINGDDTLAFGVNERQDLLRRHDGWLKQTREQCYAVSADGDTIEHAIFMDTLKSMPPEYSITDHRWWMHPWVWHDYISLLQARATAVGDAALTGQALAPYGYPVVLVPSLPRDNALTVYSLATAARVLGTRHGPFALETNAFQIRIDVDNAGPLTIALPTKEDTNVQDRLLLISRVAALINTAYAATYGQVYSNIARIGDAGALELLSPTNGAASEIEIIAVANDAYTALGLTVGVTNGEAAAAGGRTIHEGSAMWLSPAWNFVWHYVTGDGYNAGNGLRMYTKYDQGSDSVLTDIYSWQGASIMTPAATILVDNLRTLKPDTSNAVPT